MKRKIRPQLPLRAIAWGFLAASAVTGLAGLRFHASVGFDRERRDSAGVMVAYERLNWRGDGTVGLAWGQYRIGLGERPNPHRFDLAGCTFQPRQPTTARTGLERLGFRARYDRWPDPTANATSHFSAELAVPVWLPLVIGALWVSRETRKYRAKDRNRAVESG